MNVTVEHYGRTTGLVLRERSTPRGWITVAPAEGVPVVTIAADSADALTHTSIRVPGDAVDDLIRALRTAQNVLALEARGMAAEARGARAIAAVQEDPDAQDEFVAALEAKDGAA